MATDPLSLVFICCFLIGALFLGVSSLFGFGHHAGHLSHAPHISPAHAPLHVGPGGAAHGTAHNATPAAAHAGSASHHVLPPGPHIGPHQSPSSAPQAPSSFHATALLDYLSPLSLMSFLTLFGLTGYVLHNYTTLALAIIFALAVLMGIAVVTVALRLLDRLIGSDAGTLSVGSGELIGTLARVSVRIRPGGVGEVIYLAEQGTRHSVGARSIDDSAISRDAEVVIVDYRNGVAYVQEWNAFLLENKASNQQSATSNQPHPPIATANGEAPAEN